jgi:3-oxoacyl-[acyl-carrier-protein] synthase II
MDRRVVVTGLGAVSSIGIGKEEFWRNLLAGKSGITPICSFDTSEYRVKIGGEIPGFSITEFLPEERSEKYGRASGLGISASLLALEDAHLRLAQIQQHPVEASSGASAGVFVGSTMGECQEQAIFMRGWVSGSYQDIQTSTILKLPDSFLACNIMDALKIGSLGSTFPNACAAANYAIAYGYELIRSGQVPVVLAGGCDAFSEVAFAGFGRMLSLATDKCQPFDKNRSGIVVGEGAGMLVLESLGHAEKRGARIYAELLGYGMSCDAYHMTIPHVDGVTAVMENALHNTGLSPEEISFISAHGTGTVMNDKTESEAIRNVFGERAQQIPVNAVKSMLGHTMGAASALSAIGCVLSIYDSKIPPTINYETPDEQCPVDCVPNKMREQPVEVAMNNAFAFGGNNCTTVFAKLRAKR